MKGKESAGRDPAKRAAKRARHREAVKAGIEHLGRSARHSQSQMTHASSSRANKQRAEGQRAMDRERQV